MENDCKSQGGHLAEIREQAANDKIVWLKKNSKNWKKVFAIGGNDLEQEGRWVWPSDGQSFFNINDVENIIPRQKWSMALTSDTEKNCMVMKEDSTWRDEKCNSLKYVLCEATIVEGKAVHLDLDNVALFN